MAFAQETDIKPQNLFRSHEFYSLLRSDSHQPLIDFIVLGRNLIISKLHPQGSGSIQVSGDVPTLPSLISKVWAPHLTFLEDIKEDHQPVVAEVSGTLVTWYRVEVLQQAASGRLV